jgi:hypothetical protein
VLFFASVLNESKPGPDPDLGSPLTTKRKFGREIFDEKMPDISS